MLKPASRRPHSCHGESFMMSIAQGTQHLESVSKSASCVPHQIIKKKTFIVANWLQSEVKKKHVK